MSRRTRFIIRESLESILNSVDEEENISSGIDLLNRFHDLSPTSRSNVLNRLRLMFESRARRRLYDEYSDDEDMENAIYNSNNNFKQFSKENDINFRNYPFNINWVEIENDENEYYYILSKYGYFGVSIYSHLNNIKKLTSNNNDLIVLIAEMFSTFLKKENFEKVKDFIYSLSQTPEMIYNMIKKKLILVKEIPVFIIMLIILEIFYFKYDNEEYKNHEKQKYILKSQFTLINMINDDEYQKIYNESFKGKPVKILRKLNYHMKKERKLYLKHINQMNNDLILLKKGFDVKNFNL